MASGFALFVCISISISAALASDSSPIQDFRVADSSSPLMVNGFACKDPKMVQANDFYLGGLHSREHLEPRRIKGYPCICCISLLGEYNPTAFATQISGLDTLGISMARVDYTPWGINPPHTHPRATEILMVLEGSLEVGFVTSNPGNRHFTKVLNKGDVFVFPIGLVHYQRNVGNTSDVAIAALSSQNPGVITVANAVFGSTPDISSDILLKAFQLDKNTITYLQSTF